MMIRMTSLTNLQSDEAALLFPSLASLQPDGLAWRLGVSGMVYRRGPMTLGKRLMVGILRRAMRVSRDEMDTDLFRERANGFLIDAVRGRRLCSALVRRFIR